MIAAARPATHSAIQANVAGMINYARTRGLIDEAGLQRATSRAFTAGAELGNLRLRRTLEALIARSHAS